MGTEEMINIIADCAKEVRRLLTPGFEEKVYKNAMFIELRDHGLTVETEVPFKVFYKQHVVGDYRADIIVDRRVIVELKAVDAIKNEHVAQVLNYLHASQKKLGYIINFGVKPLQRKRVVL